MIALSRNRLKKKPTEKKEIQSLETMCLIIIAKLLELNDNEHDNSFNVLYSLSPSLSLSSSLFNLLTKFNRSTLRHFATTCISFIKCLDLSNSRITNESLKHVGEIITLEKLNLSKCYHVSDDGIEHLAGIPHLRHFNGSNIKITSLGIRKIAKMFPELEVVDLSHIPFKEDDFGFWGVKSPIRKLDLSYTRMTTRGLWALTHRLKLELKSKNENDNKSENKTEKGGLFHLKQLALCGNERLELDDVLTVFPHLERLDLFQTKIAQSDVHEIERAYNKQNNVVHVNVKMGLVEIIRNTPKWEETEVTNETWKQEKLREYLELADDREIEEKGKNEPSWPTARNPGESLGDRIALGM